MSLLYWLSKFSQEAMLIELFLIGLISLSYFGYLLLKKKKYGAAKKNIPDNVVRAYLTELISQAEGFKNQLFGENFKIEPGQGLNLQAQAPSFPVGMTTESADTGPLRAQLAAAMAKQQELQQAVAMLQKEKSAVESRLNNASSAAAAGAADSKALNDLKDKLTKLESRLAEYEIIEDDLANLKKYQQENKQLRAKLQAMGANLADIQPVSAPSAPKDAPKAEAAPQPLTPPPATKVDAEPATNPKKEEPKTATPTPEPDHAATRGSAAGSPEPSPLSTAEETVTAEKAAESFDDLMGQVGQSLSGPAGASAAEPAPATTPPAAPAAPAAAAPAPAPAREKSDADLLSEFERMLNS